MPANKKKTVLLIHNGNMSFSAFWRGDCIFFSTHSDDKQAQLVEQWASIGSTICAPTPEGGPKAFKIYGANWFFIVMKVHV